MCSLQDVEGMVINQPTGKQVLKQAREQLETFLNRLREQYGANHPMVIRCQHALAALEGCTVLTASEAHSIATVLRHTKGWHNARVDALAILGADE